MKSFSVPVYLSARHIHVTAEDWRQLFGEQEPTVKRSLHLGEHYLAAERVTLKGAKGEMAKVAIVGPYRAATQVELSITDAMQLGIQAPIKVSGQLDGAGSVTIIGPQGQVTKSCAIISQRHLHLSAADAEHQPLTDGQIVSAEIDSPRGGVLNQVVVRIISDGESCLHLDTDEGNALGVDQTSLATIIS